jgi:hypothetical protein
VRPLPVQVPGLGYMVAGEGPIGPSTLAQPPAQVAVYLSTPFAQGLVAAVPTGR